MDSMLPIINFKAKTSGKFKSKIFTLKVESEPKDTLPLLIKIRLGKNSEDSRKLRHLSYFELKIFLSV